MNYTNDLRLIKHILDFLLENNIEHECIEYEAETIHECLERLLKVVEPYYEEMGDVE